MHRPRPAVAEITLAAGLLVACGLVVGAIGLAGVGPDDGRAPTVVVVVGGILFACWLLYMRRKYLDITAEAGPDAEEEPLARPGSVVARQAVLLAVGTGWAVTQDFELPMFGAVVAALGAGELLLAATLHRWEARTGRRLVLRPVYRLGGTGARAFGGGWIDPANFSTRS